MVDPVERSPLPVLYNSSVLAHQWKIGINEKKKKSKNLTYQRNPQINQKSYIYIYIYMSVCARACVYIYIYI